MRLIDADALIQKRNHAKAYAPDMYVIGQGYVMDAPTIDAVPVVRGEWKRDIGDRHSSGEYRYCTACGGNAFHLYGMIRNYKYCPNCGARMDGEKLE